MAASPYQRLIALVSRRRAAQDGDCVHELLIRGERLAIADGADSHAAVMIAQELEEDCYRLSTILFAPGDIVLDIGAHVGVFSCFLARRYPRIQIYAFEPVPSNYRNLVRNIRMNRIRNVTTFHSAVTADGRDVRIMVHPANTGGASIQQRDRDSKEHLYFSVPSRTLDAILESTHIGKCKLLKIDCEGSEYEILHSSHRLGAVEFLRGEFHINSRLEEQGHSVEELLSFCQRFISPGNMEVTQIRMAE